MSTWARLWRGYRYRNDSTEDNTDTMRFFLPEFQSLSDSYSQCQSVV